MRLEIPPPRPKCQGKRSFYEGRRRFASCDELGASSAVPTYCYEFQPAKSGGVVEDNDLLEPTVSPVICSK